MASQDNLEIINRSDVGKRRPHNEDSTVSDLKMGMVLVADGMGGYKAGEVASAIAATTILHGVKEGLKKLKSDPRINGINENYKPQSNLLVKVINQANSMIYNTAQKDKLCHGMGTTIVMGLFHDEMISIANVGDSRLYRLRDGHLVQITRDHSLLQEIIDRGLMTPEEAEANTPKNLVTRALGIDAKVKVDIFEEQVKSGDIYLLCSDGLNDMVKDEEIHLTLSKYSANLVQAVDELIELANSRGGKDNISIVLAHMKNTNNNSKNFNFIRRIFDV